MSAEVHELVSSSLSHFLLSRGIVAVENCRVPGGRWRRELWPKPGEEAPPLSVFVRMRDEDG